MLPAEFELAIPASQRPQTHHSAAGIGYIIYANIKFKEQLNGYLSYWVDTLSSIFVYKPMGFCQFVSNILLCWNGTCWQHCMSETAAHAAWLYYNCLIIRLLNCKYSCVFGIVFLYLIEHTHTAVSTRIMLVLRLFVCSFPKFFILNSTTSVKSLLYNVGSHFWLYFASHVLKMWLSETLVIKHQIRISIGRNCMENALASNVHNVSIWPIMSTIYKNENHSGHVHANSPLTFRRLMSTIVDIPNR